MERLTVTVPEMAQMLGIGRIKAYELANIKGFPAIRLGKRIVVPVDHPVERGRPDQERPLHPDARSQ